MTKLQELSIDTARELRYDRHLEFVAYKFFGVDCSETVLWIDSRRTTITRRDYCFKSQWYEIYKQHCLR